MTHKWREVLGELDITLRATVREAKPRFEDGRVVLAFATEKSFHYQVAMKHLNEIKRIVREELGVENVETELEDDHDYLRN
jgi:hypothetical protein